MLVMILFRHVGCRYLKYFYLDKSRRRTNGWYSHYQTLVQSVPAVGTTRTIARYSYYPTMVRARYFPCCWHGLYPFAGKDAKNMTSFLRKYDIIFS